MDIRWALACGKYKKKNYKNVQKSTNVIGLFIYLTTRMENIILLVK